MFNIVEVESSLGSFIQNTLGDAMDALKKFILV